MVAAALAVVASPLASSEPDGLERVAADHGFEKTTQEHLFEDGPVAGYRLEGVPDTGRAEALAALAGVLVTFTLGVGLLALLRRRAGARDRGDPS